MTRCRWIVLLWIAAGAATAQGQFQTLSQRAAALRRVTVAQRALDDAVAALAKAEQAVLGTEGEERQTSERLVEQAREKLDAAKRELARRNTEVLAAAARDAAAARAAATRRRQPFSPDPQERPHADPADPLERFALLAPGGPIVVEVSLTIDGQPFRQARERVIDDMLAAADKDQDGTLTWEEAMSSPRFALGRAVADNDEQRKLAIQSSDLNGDGLVDRPEARRFVSARYGAPTFLLQAAPTSSRTTSVLASGTVLSLGDPLADLQALLDRDGDTRLSQQEVAAAAERLKSRDGDDNDVLDAVEVSGIAQAPAGLEAAMRDRVPREPSLTCVQLGPAISADALYAVLSQRYMVRSGAIKAESFAAMPRLFVALDEDGDGKLQKFEAARLSEIEPQIALAIDLGHERQGRGLSVRSLSPELAELVRSERRLSLAAEGVLLTVTANPGAARGTDYERSAEAMIARFDKDSNGYLEKSEVAENVAARLAGWDGDGDGKVYAKEIAAAGRQSAAPRATQVVAYAMSQGNSLFQILDQDGDSQLGLREMRSAGARIGLLDKDRDAVVGEREIPALMSVSFGRGLAGQGAPRVESDLPAVDGPQAGATPEWFARMDRNGDGDISLREFLGDRDDFRRLDADGDGLVSADEAARP